MISSTADSYSAVYGRNVVRTSLDGYNSTLFLATQARMEQQKLDTGKVPWDLPTT